MERILDDFCLSVRRIRLMKSIWQHLKLNLEKNSFQTEEVEEKKTPRECRMKMREFSFQDALQRVFNVYCLITSVCQAFVSCRIREIQFQSSDENDFYLSWLTIDEISSIYGYLINALVYLGTSSTLGLFSLAHEFVLATIVATSVYISGKHRCNEYETRHVSRRTS